MKILYFITVIVLTAGISVFTVVRVVETERQQKIASYNAGYRAGKLDITSYLVECEGVTDMRVIAARENSTKIMRELRELDNSPYPCGE